MRLIGNFEEARAFLKQCRALEMDLPSSVRDRIREVFGQDLPPREAVRRILEDVRARGDGALEEYAWRLDAMEPGKLEVPEEEMARAREQVPRELLQALSLAAERIRAFHQKSLPRSWMDFEEGYGQRVVPMERAGIYIPGGTATYPSTVLMTAIPARVAGVRQVVMATPSPSPPVLAAAVMAGVDRVFRIGGAQAIAAMAYGTEMVPRVDIICGPGNLFVTLAKKEVFGEVAIDGLYGPTETVLIADEHADPSLCAADLLAQAEHDWTATPVFITTSAPLAREVERELHRQLDLLERRDIARHCLERRGCLILVRTLEEALALADEFAPEHLSLMVRNPWDWISRVHHAGSLFLGESSPEVVGDYVAGPSHNLPTAGTARFSSGLGVHSFLKRIPIVAVEGSTSFTTLMQASSTLARAEGFTGHARAAERRMGSFK